MSESLTIRLSDELANALREESRRTGLTRGEIACQALEARFDAKPKLHVMRRHFGRARGPSDLSTDKNYRRSWGKWSS